MQLKRKKELYKSIIALLMSGAILSTPIAMCGCNGTEENSKTESEIESNEGKQYALLQFGGTVQIVEIKRYEPSYKGDPITVKTSDGKEFVTASSNLYVFDKTSKEQIDIVNKILEEHEEETLPYTYVKKQ